MRTDMRTDMSTDMSTDMRTDMFTDICNDTGIDIYDMCAHRRVLDHKCFFSFFLPSVVIDFGNCN